MSSASPSLRVVKRSALVPQSAAQMYAIVNDVPSYPSFVPWCAWTAVHESSETAMRATVSIARAGVTIAVTTQNRLTPGRDITLTLVEGPLASLDGSWQFTPILDEQGAERGSRVALDMRFSFRNAALSLVLGPLFEASWDSLVDVFVRRARELYPARPRGA